MKQLFIGMPLVFLVAACSKTSDFMPESGATGEDIFKTACVECHAPKEGGHYFELSADMSNVAAISNKVKEGSFAMPAFTKIEGQALDGLAEYVLSLNKPEN